MTAARLPAVATPRRVLAVAPEPDWSFADLKQTETLWGPHGYHRYPAKFIPQLVRAVIERYSVGGALVGDPFVGSATTGVEALRAGRYFWGSDINPIAVLIGQAKCAPLEPRRLAESWRRLNAKIESAPHTGWRSITDAERDLVLAIDIARAGTEERLRYWFPEPHREALARLLDAIVKVRAEDVRTFYLCAFSNILRVCSLWLSGSTKPQKDFSRTLYDPVDALRRQVRDQMRRNALYWKDIVAAGAFPEDIAERFSIGAHDARDLPLDDGVLDLAVTSPPYATCYQYLELHQLTRIWFETYGLVDPTDLREECIGGMRVSERDVLRLDASTGSKVADAALAEITAGSLNERVAAVSREVRALKHYFLDMGAALREIGRVVAPRKCLVLIVGDSYKRGTTIPTSEALVELASAAGFALEGKIVRRIAGRVLVSMRNLASGRFTSEGGTQIYPEEDVLVFRRKAAPPRRPTARR